MPYRSRQPFPAALGRSLGRSLLWAWGGGLILCACAVAGDPPTANRQLASPDTLSVLALLRDEDVCDRLQLTEAQHRSLNDVEGRWAHDLEEHGSLPPEERDRDQLQKTMREFESEALELLKPEQRTQLKKLEQLRQFDLYSPARNLYLAECQDELRLTLDERSAVRQMQEEWEAACEKIATAKTDDQRPIAKAAAFGGIIRLLPTFREQRDNWLRLLTMEQQHRFKQIEWQTQLVTESAKEMTKVEWSSRLQLSTEQEARLKEMVARHNAEVADWNRDLQRGVNRPRPYRGLDGIGLLTPVQKKKLRELVGKPFGDVGQVLYRSLANGRSDDVADDDND